MEKKAHHVKNANNENLAIKEREILIVQNFYIRIIM